MCLSSSTMNCFLQWENLNNGLLEGSWFRSSFQKFIWSFKTLSLSVNNGLLEGSWFRSSFQKFIWSFKTLSLSVFLVTASRPSFTCSLSVHSPTTPISFVSFSFSWFFLICFWAMSCFLAESSSSGFCISSLLTLYFSLVTGTKF